MLASSLLYRLERRPHSRVIPLSPKQQRFVAEYLKDLNGKQAAIRSGYSPKTAEVQASRLLRNAQVASEVARKSREQLDAVDVSAEDVKRRLALIGFQDIRKLFDAQGNLRPIHELPDDVAPLIAGVEVIIKNAQAGDGVTDRVHKIRVVDPLKALEMLAKHHGLLIERQEIKGDVTFTWAKS